VGRLEGGDPPIRVDGRGTSLLLVVCDVYLLAFVGQAEPSSDDGGLEAARGVPHVRALWGGLLGKAVLGAGRRWQVSCRSLRWWFRFVTGEFPGSGCAEWP